MPPDSVRVEALKFAAAPPEETARGLLAYLGFRIGPLVLDGVTLRRTRAGHLALSYPERRDATGRQHPYVSPVDNAVRRAIEAAVIAALRAQAESGP